MPFGGASRAAVQPDVHLRRQGPGEIKSLLNDLLDGDGLKRDGQPARLNARNVQHLIDEFQQMAAALQDILDRFPLLRVKRVHFQELGEAQDGVERSAQFVAHPREEFALGPVGAIGILPGPLQFCSAFGHPLLQNRGMLLEALAQPGLLDGHGELVGDFTGDVQMFAREGFWAVHSQRESASELVLGDEWHKVEIANLTGPLDLPPRRSPCQGVAIERVHPAPPERSKNLLNVSVCIQREPRARLRPRLAGRMGGEQHGLIPIEVEHQQAGLLAGDNVPDLGQSRTGDRSRRLRRQDILVDPMEHLQAGRVPAQRLFCRLGLGRTPLKRCRHGVESAGQLVQFPTFTRKPGARAQVAGAQPIGRAHERIHLA